MADQAVFDEIRAEFNEALPALSNGQPDRTDFMQPLWRADGVNGQRSYGGDTKDRLIMSVVMEVYGVSRGEMRSFIREEVALEARWMAYYAMMMHGSRSASKIGRYMKRDHSSILSGRDKIAEALSSDTDVRARYYRVCRDIGVSP